MSNNIIEILQSEKFKQHILTIIPHGPNAFDKINKSIIAEIKKNPKFLEVDTQNLLNACYNIFTLGLEVGQLGHAYIIPNYKNCKFIIGYKGYIELARRTNNVAIITANTVDEADTFKFQYGKKADLLHVPALEQTNKIIYAYADILFKDGIYQFVVLRKDEIDKIKEADGNKNPAWNMWTNEMMKKTALRRLFKYVPISTEISKAVSIDEAEEFNSQTQQTSSTENLINKLEE